ncbi:MAG: MBL fold metallo-hydrolase [Phycisphaeraceae bacterium]|nr:MBL fold metallo-hydrolase [Phycisphaeraceae bacterium]
MSTGAARSSRVVSMLWLVVLGVVLGACRAAEPIEGPRLRILGSVQDGGLPHAGCSCVRCEAAAAGRWPARYVASCALLVPVDGRDRVVLIDATPDVGRQLRLLRDVRGGSGRGVDRAPIDGVILTHAHIGHYLGLAQFGFEVMHTSGLPVSATQRMAAFLRGNAPWSELVRREEISIEEIAPGVETAAVGGVAWTPVGVPHRDELSDTVAVLIRGPTQRVLYLPDCDPWHRWEARALELLSSCEVAILDATFFDGEELPGRDLTAIGHPLVIDTMELLRERVERGELRVILTHMNHSNPLLEPRSIQRERTEAAGFEIAVEGLEIPL